MRVLKLDRTQILRGYQGCVNTKYILALYVTSHNRYSSKAELLQLNSSIYLPETFY